MFLDVNTGSLRRRIAWIGVILIASPMLILSLAAWFVLHRISETPMVASVNNLTHLTQNLVDICHSYHQQTLAKLENGRKILEAAGQVRLDPDRSLTWRARNEANGEFKNLQLPLMIAGTVQFEPVRSFADAAPIVDEIEKIAGTPATVFQRSSESGDMLRVASTVKAEDGERAIGSFMPLTDPLRKVLAGETYIAHSRLGKTVYLTAYQPLKSAGEVIGMLATALPEDEIAMQVRNMAVKTMTSDHNDFFAFEASGERRLDGRELWSEKDVQELCKRARGLADGEVAEYKYRKTIRPSGLPQIMDARFAYVKELDWVVGFAQPDAKSLAAVSPLQALIVWGMWVLLGVGAVSTCLAIRIWIHLSDDMADKLAAMLNHLTDDAKQLSNTAIELSDETEARQLILLARGIDQTVKTINEDLGINVNEPRA